MRTHYTPHLKQDRAMSGEDVAKAMGDITPSGVYRLEKTALRKLRRNPVLFLNYIESLERERRSRNVGTLAKDEYSLEEDII